MERYYILKCVNVFKSGDIYWDVFKNGLIYNTLRTYIYIAI